MFSSLNILGSTGSIGTQTLEVVRRFPERFRVAGLSAGRNVELLARQVREFRPDFVHVAFPEYADELRGALDGWRGPLLTGADGLVELAAEAPADLVVVATVGFAGLAPTLAAIRAGRHIALANKEVLVCGGHLVMREARARALHMLPIDSEHNALFQCMACGSARALRRIILTCSGGSFRNASREQIDAAQAAETLRHPTWTMGSKITVDSATLMNKGFEVIEAHHLFDVPAEKIEVVIHPQSTIHSMVEFVDGSMIAQLGVTDMRLPIQNVLTWPERLETDLAPLSLSALSRLDFSEPDHARFPCLGMAYEAMRAGGGMPCVLNAANEVAVAAHLGGRITCGAIPRLIRAVLDATPRAEAPTLDDLRAIDAESRARAGEWLG